MNTKKLTGALIRSFWAGILLLALWANLFIVFSVRMYAGHARWFNLSYHEFELCMYGAMIFFKLCLLIFFLLPYIGLRWADYSEKKRT
jgi:hypothetical protein